MKTENKGHGALLQPAQHIQSLADEKAPKVLSLAQANHVASSARKLEQPVMMKIVKIEDEAENIKTFYFNRKQDFIDKEGREKAFGDKEEFTSSPGQFVMLWLPRLNMKPFGVSYQDKDLFALTICKVGPFTEQVFEKKPGDFVGIIGPYGNGFLNAVNKNKPKNAVLVAGGYGVAPLAFLADTLITKGANVTFIIGAKTEKLLVYRKRYANTKAKMVYTTDDGSFGEKCFTTDALLKVLENNKTIDTVYTCGPEIMMENAVEVSDKFNVNCFLSLERYMKCGFGICGQCCCDNSGTRVCLEGPVFSKEYIKENISEFGIYKRDGTGKRI